MMSSGGRKRSNSGSASAAKRGKSPGRGKVVSKADRKAKYNRRYPKTIYLPLNNPSGAIGPNRIFAKLKYAGKGYTSTISGGVTTAGQTFRLNSLNDPDFTGVGIQPYGYDNILGLGYNRYLVRAVKVKVIPMATGPSATTLAMQMISLVPVTNVTTLPLTWAEAAMRGMPTMTQTLLPSSGTTGSDMPAVPRYIKGFWRIKDILGRALDESLDGATSVNNPTQTCNLTVCCDNSPANAVSFTFAAVLTYYVDFEQGVSVNDS